MPTAWFNIMPSIVQAGMQPLPPLHPGTHEPVAPDLLAPLFPEALIMQEVATEEWIDIPGEVLDVYRLWRPSPLHRAVASGAGAPDAGPDLLQVRGGLAGRARTSRTPRSRRPTTTRRPARSGSPPRPAPGSGAPRSRWRAAFFGIDCQVFMVKASYEQKPYRRIFMETFGAEVVAVARRRRPQAGKASLEADPESHRLARARDQRGGRGRRHERRRDQVRARLGAEPRPAAPDGDRAGGQGADGAGRRGAPDVVIGCVGGGSTYAGLAYPFMADRLGRAHADAVHRDRAGRLSDPDEGRFAYDFGDTAGMTPLLPMYTLGHTFVPAPVHAGGSALPRRLAVALAARAARATWRRARTRRTRSSRRRSGSRTPQGIDPRAGVRARAEGRDRRGRSRRARPTRSA